MYKPNSGLYIVDWLSWINHAEDRDQIITGMNIDVSAINTSVYMSVFTSIEDI